MAGRVTQVATEVVVSPTGATPNCRVTQLAAEVVVSPTGSTPNCRVTQICIEVIQDRIGQRPFRFNGAVSHMFSAGAIGGSI